ncbi:hypothetical protein P3W85_39200 [Cupriavidus basilensis]|uniref:AtuA-like ferredoxin-fold domain-containing protein n=1 Tax=Cupriavidus basilensis TaxID=68895 RepID=A0ABT6B218_9BURK|nr:hypothetical protein [Cupriavidus basilensis]MDF3838921.1 hypothetical protein [Cupriavidus basilensis]
MNATQTHAGHPHAPAATIALYQLAHGRTGDKGDRSNISVIAYDPRDFDHLAAHVTEDAVAALFRHRQPQAVRRYLVPSLQAMNFVIDGVLDGGVNDALNLDTHGKALSFLLLQLEIPLPPRLSGAG